MSLGKGKSITGSTYWLHTNKGEVLASVYYNSNIIANCKYCHLIFPDQMALIMTRINGGNIWGQSESDLISFTQSCKYHTDIEL